MSAEEENTDKPFEATQRKLEDARKKGEFVRSPDVVNLGVLAIFLVAVYTLFQGTLSSVLVDIQKFIVATGSRSQEVTLDNSASSPFRWFVILVFTTLATPAIGVLLGLIATKQLVFTTDKLKPKLNRLSLVANLKKKLGAAGLVEFGKSFLKFLVFAGLFLIWILDTWEPFESLAMLDPYTTWLRFFEGAFAWLICACLTFVVFAAIDVIWQISEHAKKNRMSHKEMKDEQKNEEGDESMRQQRRMKAEEIATNRMLLDVPKSSVVITNPTHFAVALKWSGGPQDVPKCVAKGTDETARKIREIAIQSGVPIYQDPPTARQLFSTVKIGASIEQDHYRAVAAAIGYARRIQKMARA